MDVNGVLGHNDRVGAANTDTRVHPMMYRSSEVVRTTIRAAMVVLVALAITLPSGEAAAQATLLNGFGGAAGYGPNGQCLSRNDDGSGPAVDVTPVFPTGLRFFTQTHTSMYVNTNGNITFSDRLSTFTPNPFPVANQPMIAPYWGDVDIRQQSGTCSGFSVGTTCTVCQPCHNPSENGIWWHFDVPNQRIIITWDRVGYYNCNNDRRMSFQLILSNPGGCSEPGDFDVEFRFNRCEWETRRRQRRQQRLWRDGGAVRIRRGQPGGLRLHHGIP